MWVWHKCNWFKLEIVPRQCHFQSISGVGVACEPVSDEEALTMKIACLGGGPAGLYFAISMKLRDPSHDITVIERNRADDTFGWGVVLSDETLANLHENDPVSAAAIKEYFAYWDDIALIHKASALCPVVTAFAASGEKSC